ncbi:GTPase Era [Sphingomonas sediminicola]|uniref:GTPase Era n=1 Tax=Sphingomonas sediminicola TaxID=386874 RepID=A0ABX6TAY0_9SPHN|nr:GTPase Era [Sphingomonas sediminicola]QNP46529.1 GTPase Era [Sphingomonas sediminicola]
MTEKTTRAGFVAVIGAPNAGKSTLVNALVGQKVAIVSAKAQTTRARLMGIAIQDQSQILLVDTPGIFEPRRRLDRAMVAAAWGGAGDADLILLVIDASDGLNREVERIIDNLGHRDHPLWIALNKVDLVKKPNLLTLSVALTERLNPDKVFMISAAQGDGVPDLKGALAEAMPDGPWLYPEDEVSDATDRMIAAEMTREQIFNQLHQELPYSSAIETESWEDRPDGSTVIHQQIFVERDSQKAIVIGKGGSRLRTIGEKARAEISEHLGRKVHLFLHVKVNPRWGEDRSLYEDIGLEWSD